jgi:hypothetical protein
MDRDVQDGDLNKFMVQAMRNPESLPNWNKSKYDKIDKGERVMKNRKRKRQKQIQHIAQKIGKDEVPVELV